MELERYRNKDVPCWTFTQDGDVLPANEQAWALWALYEESATAA